MVDVTQNTGKNPASAAAPVKRRRIPMSVPRRKLEVSEIPGYRLYWFAESRVIQAQAAGYEFVMDHEVSLVDAGLGASSITKDKSLGSQVRVMGGMDRDTGMEREFMVLMKIKLEWYHEDQKSLEEANAKVLQGVFRGEQILGDDAVRGLKPEDKGTEYVDKDRTSFTPSKPLFQRPTRK